MQINIWDSDVTNQINDWEDFINEWGVWEMEDTVNTDQCLESAADLRQILITDLSHEKVKEFFNCNKLGEANLRNKSDAVVVYEVVS